MDDQAREDRHTLHKNQQGRPDRLAHLRPLVQIPALTGQGGKIGGRWPRTALVVLLYCSLLDAAEWNLARNPNAIREYLSTCKVDIVKGKAVQNVREQPIW